MVPRVALVFSVVLVGITATMICYVLLNLRYRHLVRGGQALA